MDKQIESFLVLLLCSPIITTSVDFCRNETSIDGITKLSNGSLFLTSGLFYWTLDERSDNSYEQPMDYNKRNITQILPNVHRIDSVQRIFNLGINGSLCGYDRGESDLLVFYWFNFHINEPEITFLYNWKPIDWKQSMQMIEVLTTNTSDIIDWNQPIDAILAYQLQNEAILQIYQTMNCVERKCIGNEWQTSTKWVEPRVNSAFWENSVDNESTVFMFSGTEFTKCIRNASNSECNPLLPIATQFFRFPSDCSTLTDHRFDAKHFESNESDGSEHKTYHKTDDNNENLESNHKNTHKFDLIETNRAFYKKPKREMQFVLNIIILLVVTRLNNI